MCPFAGSYGHLSLPSSKPEEKLNLSVSLEEIKKTLYSLHFSSTRSYSNSEPHELLLCKHREVGRRWFHTHTGEFRCIAAESGCGCNTPSAENGGKR